MNCATCCLVILLLSQTLCSDAATRCGSSIATQQQQQLQLRSTSNELSTNNDQLDEEVPPQLDLSQLSETQLQQLMQQLNLVNANADASALDVEDNRSSSRPWNRVQRIIRRQLVRIPKRYLKKFLRQFGLARSGRNRSGGSSSLSEQVQPEPQLYYLIPLE